MEKKPYLFIFAHPMLDQDREMYILVYEIDKEKAQTKLMGQLTSKYVSLDKRLFTVNSATIE